MIISDKYRFVFIHIPKCAGKSVKKYLAEYDEHPEFSAPGSMFTHPEIGRIDLTHMPLQVVRDNFPDAFEKITAYESFALVRDPYSRFRSSVSEYLRLYKKENMTQLSSIQLTKYLEEIVSVLENYKESVITNYKFIHFEKQINYVELDGDMIVRHIYNLKDISQCMQHISKITGKDIEIDSSEGCTVYARNELARKTLILLKPIIGDILNKLLSENAKKRLRKYFYSEKVKSDFNTVFESNKVRDFVESFYRDDIALYATCSQEND